MSSSNSETKFYPSLTYDIDTKLLRIVSKDKNGVCEVAASCPFIEHVDDMTIKEQRYPSEVFPIQVNFFRLSQPRFVSLSVLPGIYPHQKQLLHLSVDCIRISPRIPPLIQ